MARAWPAVVVIVALAGVLLGVPRASATSTYVINLADLPVLERPDGAPHFVLACCPKAGTTSLFRLLAQHPAVVSPHRGKELHFFTSELPRGHRWYLESWRALAAGEVAGEATPSYASSSATVAEAMKRYLPPHVVLLFVLRDPLKRLRSHINFHNRNAKGIQSFSRDWLETMADVDSIRNCSETSGAPILESGPCLFPPHHSRHEYVAKSMYHAQIEAFVDVFGPQALFVTTFEQLLATPGRELTRLAVRLGIDPAPLANATLPHTIRNEHSVQPELPTVVRDKLWPIFDEMSRRLFELLERRLGFRWPPGVEPAWDVPFDVL